MENASRKSLRDANLIVIKVGTSSLVNSNGKLDPGKFTNLAGQVSHLIQKKKKQVIIVTSGAIASGADRLGLKNNFKTIPEKQALAAIGQHLLIRHYEQSFKPHNLAVAQILLTKDAFESRKRYINSRNTIFQILKLGAVPIINENDTVSTDEIKVGDNDTLSALISTLIGADLLIILSNVDGFIMDGQTIPEINEITKDIEKMAKGTDSIHGTGGMRTKIEAAKIVNNAGIPMIICNSQKKRIIQSVLEGQNIGTLFIPKECKMKSKKRWLAHGEKSKGKLIVDEGAEKALLKNGKSLLPVGVKEIKGTFYEGDIVSIINSLGHEIGKGITNYNSDDILKIKGLKSSEIEKILHVGANDEIIHRDNMVIL